MWGILRFFQIIQEGTLPAFAGPRLEFGMRHARELDRFSLINRRNIQYTNYTQSLITEALRVRLLQAAFVDDLQMQIMGQLELLIRRFPADRALPPEQISAHNQALLDGIFFTLDTYLLSFHDPMYALSALQSESVTEMYTAGQQQLRAHYLETVALLVKARKIDSAALLPKLRKTLQTEIHEALLQHRPQFCSSAPHAFSYPCADDHIGQHRGIFYIKQYLRALLFEERFLSFYDRAELAAIAQDPQNKEDNLFLRTLHSALGSTMLGKFSGQLVLTKDEYTHLCARLAKRSQRELGQIVQLAVHTLCRELPITDVGLMLYVRRAAKEWVPALCSARGKETMREYFTMS